ncbi:MAG: putative metal-binding motif-containing protein [Nitrospirota bacterium]
MGQIKLLKILLLACTLIFTASAGYAAQYGESVGPDDLADSRTLPGPDNYDSSVFPSTVQGNSTGGLDGSWAGSDFTISWLIEYDPDTDYWTYTYTLAGSMTPSAFILEFMDTGSINNDANSIWDLVINGNSAEVGGAKDEFGTWNDNGGIDLTNPIYGHKLEVTGGSPASTTIQFTTSRAPVWGNFHTMGATSNNAYNIGLSTPFSTDPLYFIARPGSPPACPDIDGDGYVVCNATCDPGALLCGDCNEDDPSINPGAPEICSDRKDNDCDDKRDRGDPQGCISCTPTGMPEDICDGVDDDCDGLIDEDYAVTPTTCGQGECASNTGQLECQGGSEVDTCNPLAGAAAETCDNLDNDCNGTVDDNPVDAGGACSEGTGACQSDGTEVCNSGVLECNGVPGEPTAEVCNGIDDNCDGSVDENLTQPTACGVGECAGNTGIETCTTGVWGINTCDPFAGAAVDDSVCNGLDDDCDGQTDSNDIDCGGACIPPPVGQEIGIQDVLYTNLIEDDCRNCHQNPLQFPVLDVSIPDRHHLILDNVIPDPTDAPFGNPGELYECLTCHAVDSSTGIYIFIVERNCIECHNQNPSELTVHHRTDLAQGTLPQGPDCQACHGDIVDNRDDGHFIPNYEPTQSTPKRSGGTGLPFNSRGDGAGACNYCHNDGFCQTGGTPLESNMTTHHNTGFGSDSTKCDWCHDFSAPLESQFRICENCHGRDSLHNIQTDSDGDNVINPGIEQPFYGHIGNPDDCWGCHGYGASLTAPESGPVVPSISSVSESVLAEGTNTTVTLSGSAFTNMDEGTELTSAVVLTAADGSSVTLIPDSISQDSISVTIPGTLGKGNYKLKTAKLNKHSNPRVISVIPNVIITSVDCSRKRGLMTVTGSGFSEKPEGTGNYINVGVNGQKLDIISWTDTQIKASVSTCSNNETVTVDALFGSATSSDVKPPKPCRGKGCN